MGYQFKTDPFKHQLDEYEFSKDLPARGLLWEMGTGKSKTTIDTGGHLFTENKINAMFIVAPAGVHHNWTINELPTHLPDSLMEQTKMVSYSTDKIGTKRHQAEIDEVLDHRHLKVLTMSYDAITTKKGREVAWRMLKNNRCLYVADEARRIKTPSADRTKAVVKSALHAPYRRLLNGTPVPNGPFDIYSQLLFLDESFWACLGISTYTAFKTYFGIFQKGYVRDGQGNMREYPVLVSYKNLDVLNKTLDKLTTRVTKEDVLDLPPKLYSRRTFEMSSAQKKVYKQLEEEFMAFLDSGEMVAAPLALVRMLRMQQITSGFVPVIAEHEGEPNPTLDIGTDNPRLDLLKELVEDIPHKCIIWCRFRRTIEKVMEMLGKDAVRYDGTVNDDDRATAMFAFQKGEPKFFVANAQTAGEGLTLHAAKTVIYLENTFNLAERLQSEDRAHRIGQDQSVNIIDVVAEGTVDEHVTECLQKKLDIASTITGDKFRRMA